LLVVVVLQGECNVMENGNFVVENDKEMSDKGR
jgi:hypothetical protein